MKNHAAAAVLIALVVVSVSDCAISEHNLLKYRMLCLIASLFSGPASGNGRKSL